MIAPRVFVVGTDTGVGKTTLVCTLLAQARARGLAVLPFKPAQSGAAPDDPDSDAARLATAAGLPDPHAICPLWFAAPLAPGLAGDAPHDPLALAATALARAIEDHWPQLVVIEGAGGLLVPMPGATWQPDWISALADCVVVVARAGLGTINHTLLTIDALRRRDLAPLGIYLVEVRPPDPSNARNTDVLARASGVPILGTLPHACDVAPDLLGPLLTALAR